VGECCPWWLRGVHRRRRGADLEDMWRTLYARADTLEEARLAWEVFRAQDGQEHWRCPCGRPIADLFGTLTIHLAP